MANNNMQKRAHKAAKEFLSLHEFKIVDEPKGGFDFVAIDEADADEPLCFITVEVVDEFKLHKPVPPKERLKLETKAASWLCENSDIGERPMTFHKVYLMVLKDDKAMLKFMRNYMNM